MSYDQNAMERKDSRFDNHYRPVVAIFHQEGPMTTEFARKFVDESVAKWYQDIRKYGDVYQISSPNVAVLAKSGDNVVWQITISGLVKDVTEDIPSSVQRIVDETVVRGGRVSIDHNGDGVLRALQSAAVSGGINIPHNPAAGQPGAMSAELSALRALDAARRESAQRAASSSYPVLPSIQPRTAVVRQADQPDAPLPQTNGPVPTTSGSRYGIPSIRKYD